eukprot:TRINITY_DN909_c0_g1_i1.p1 TRINITY_DN909_c0_g1~~TRINITY_DN909_c0_g1_i1.p1  ORF type:complete len:542 (+),score=83.53 TRINITY_DN909_c0_g1_i1:1149-2774(+)
MDTRLLVVLLVALIAVVLADPTIVDTAYGPVKGALSASQQVISWRGLPYAAPPVGDLRFRAPRPPTPWEEPHDCTQKAKMCVQLDFVGPILEGQEDCLTLDVYVGSNYTSSEPRPVWFFIHGGAFIFGASHYYDGFYVAERHNAIVVLPNYRLNVFGFLAHPALRAEDPDSSTGNLGIRDQQLALRWVQNNIHKFGGDPAKVMLMGESAGGMSVCAHLAMPSSAGLFSAAIMESGTCDAPEFFFPLQNAEAFGHEYVGSVGCNDTSSAKLLSCLRTLQPAALMQTVLGWILNHEPFFPIAPLLAPIAPWGPVIDGSHAGLPQLPLDALKSGNFNKVPTIMGTNQDEGSIFIPVVPLIVRGTLYPLTEAGLAGTLLHFFNQSTTDAILTAYSRQWFNPLSPTLVAAQILRDYIFVCATRRALRAVSQYNDNTWSYEFTYPYINDSVSWLLGDYHSAEVRYVFGMVDNPSEHDLRMFDVMGEYWGAMATYNNPNGPLEYATVPKWPLFTSTESDTTLSLNENPSAVTGLRQATCDFWDTVYKP